MEELPGWIKDNKTSILLGTIGLVLMGIGGWNAVSKDISKDQTVTIVGDDRVEEGKGVKVVDVSGAVEKPGVYAMPFDARVNDALIEAGGLSLEADRNYVARNMNLAEKLTDGMKLYVPEKLEVGEQELLIPSTEQTHIVRVNSANRIELEELWGVGSARAQSIIDNRPYISLDDLKIKANIPQNVLDKNEGIIQL